MFQDRPFGPRALVSLQALSPRQRAARRRMAALIAAAAFAAAGWTAGAWLTPQGGAGGSALGPFSYFPS
ncbi:MAG: hypothetical protein ACK4YQ_01760 [Phenylobacterium sp.]|uniref:hypothetical protein n=1 Tax=Phenylobacterium sp. TaxID=1871053 RepID=UPI00391C8E61